MPLLQLSESETLTTGLVTAYANAPLLQKDVDAAMIEIFRGNLDFVYLTTAIGETSILPGLHPYCIPVSMGSTATWLQIGLQQLPELLTVGYSLHLFTTSDSGELGRIIKGPVPTNTLRSSGHPVIRQFLNAQRERDSFVEYLITFQQGGREGSFGFVLQKDKQTIGFCFGHVEDSSFVIEWLFVQPDIQLREAHGALLHHIGPFLRQMGMNHLWVQLPNDGELNHLVIELRGKVHTRLNLLLYPLFKFSATKPVEQNLSARSTRSLLERTPSLRVGSKTSHRRLLRSLVGQQSYHVIQTIPIENDQQRMTLTRVYEHGESLIAYMYHYFSKPKS
jgi:hypothetical protein